MFQYNEYQSHGEGSRTNFRNVAQPSKWATSNLIDVMLILASRFECTIRK